LSEAKPIISVPRLDHDGFRWRSTHPTDLPAEPLHTRMAGAQAV